MAQEKNNLGSLRDWSLGVVILVFRGRCRLFDRSRRRGACDGDTTRQRHSHRSWLPRLVFIGSFAVFAGLRRWLWRRLAGGSICSEEVAALLDEIEQLLELVLALVEIEILEID